MNYLKRGLLSITRKKMKTAILFLVVFILGVLMAGSVSIKKSLNNAEDSIDSGVPPIATVAIDWEKAYEGYTWEEGVEPPKVEEISEETIKKIGELPYVKNYDYSVSTGMSLDEDSTIKAYSGDPDSETSKLMGMGYSWIQIKGVQDPEIFAIKEGAIKLKSGSVFTAEQVKEGKNVAIVSDKFAEINQLSVGDTISNTEKVRYIAEYENITSETDIPVVGEIVMELEIVGIYEIPEKPKTESNNQTGFSYNDEDTYKYNIIYSTNSYVSKLFNDYTSIIAEADPEVTNSETVSYEPVYTLKEASMIDDFKEEAQALLPEQGTVIDTTDSYAALKKPMQNLSSIANIVLWASIGVAVVILSLLTTLFLHDRRHEMGIYMSMGERKSRVILQVLSEVMIVAVISLTISLFVGNIATKGFSKDMLLDNAEETIQNELNNGYMYYDFGGIADSGPVTDVSELEKSYEVSLDGSTLVLFYGVSIATIVVSTIIPTMYILRLKPKKILM